VTVTVSVRLSPHFTSQEFACHDGTPVPRGELHQLEHLCRAYLEPLRRVWGPVRVLSGYRPRAYNAQVGGAPHSYHVYDEHHLGVAADVACARGRPADWYRTLAMLHPGGLGKYADHVHVDSRPGLARW